MSRTNRAWMLISALSVVVLLTACGNTSTVTTVATNPPPTATATTPAPTVVKVYFSKNPDSGNNFNTVYPVNRTTTSARVGTFGIEQLIVGPTQAEAATGLFSQLKTQILGAPAHGDDHCGAGITFSLTITSGVARMQFCGQTTSGGIGDDARTIAEINATLKQFPTVSTVKICSADGNSFGNEGPPVNC